nr:unnamed protein product [Digitaria exilis]
MMNGAAAPERSPSASPPPPAQAPPSPSPTQPLDWKFSQVFGERSAGEEVQEVDIISAIEFNKSGHHLATGDRGGRVVLFERTDVKDHACRKEAEKADYSISRHPEFRYKTEFQSHEPEVQEKKVKKVSEMNLSRSAASANEVITSAEFHPTHCNTLAYSSSKGSIRLVDLRQSALCDTHSQIFEQHEALGSRSFFTEIIASISDIKFSKDGRHILSRDYMTLKLWDVKMNSGPVATFQVHEYLRPKLCDLYENDSIFDKFECCQSGDGLRVATGSYSCGNGSNEATTLEATRNPTRRQLQNPTRAARSLSTLTRAVRRGGESTGIDANGNSYDLSTKLLHLAWHPSENLIACAAANSLYMYYA